MYTHIYIYIHICIYTQQYICATHIYTQNLCTTVCVPRMCYVETTLLHTTTHMQNAELHTTFTHSNTKCRTHIYTQHTQNILYICPTYTQHMRNIQLHATHTKHRFHLSNNKHSDAIAVTNCNTLQHTATYCNTLQHTATQ